MLNNIIDRIKLHFRKDKELYLSLYELTGFIPREISHYKLAMMHRSMAQRNEKGKPINNERLEFLGDAILDAIVGDIVYQHFPGKREGFLTNTRSKIVKRETLNRLSKEMGILQLIHTNGRQTSTHNSHLAGNAFEALVGALYLDRGYDACMRFMEKRILGELINIDKVAYKEMNFKSKLIEWSQKNRVVLEFDMLEEQVDGKGSPVFRFVTKIEGVEGCEGTGYSKKESQQIASKLTLQRLRKDSEFIDTVFAAKSDRTKMEEMPTSVAPDVEQKVDFVVTHTNEKYKEAADATKETNPQAAKSEKDAESKPSGAYNYYRQKEEEEREYIDIVRSKDRQSREEIIAAAEAAAFSTT